jgi:hypothetical protein
MNPASPRANPSRLLENEQCASRVLLIRPHAFARNEAAARSNAFMHDPTDPSRVVALRALAEFDGLAGALADAGAEVVLIEDDLHLPDSVFPNNWISYHEPREGSPVIITYPMATPARRLERRETIIDRVRELTPGHVERLALGDLEGAGEFLEGTGSLVLDRTAGVAFACRSVRTTDRAMDIWSEATGYEIVRFDADDGRGVPVYHTNVLMSIGERFAVVCGDSIQDAAQRSTVLGRLQDLGKEIVDISLTQMGGMCANVLEIRSAAGEPLIAMSRTAWTSFTRGQQAVLTGLARPVVAPIPTIEQVGGGSVRCMIAEIGRSRLARSS